MDAPQVDSSTEVIRAKYRYYYLCDSLDCGLYYYSMFELRRPVIKVSVFVPRLDTAVTIEYLGFGDEGLRQVEEKTGRRFILPVDLYSDEYKIDPQLSRTVTPEMMQEWEEIVEWWIAMQEVLRECP